MVDGLDELKLERKLIKQMTKKNRLSASEIKLRKEFIELKKRYDSNLDSEQE